MRRRLLLASALLMAAGCGGDDVTGPSALTGTRWKLDSLRTPTGIVSTVNPDRYTIEFQDDGRVSAQADCNVCTGSYRAVGAILITIGPLSCTRAFCGSGSRGDEYVALLGNTKLYAKEGDTLVLVANEGTLLYKP